jgi:hypothetical protein
MYQVSSVTEALEALVAELTARGSPVEQLLEKGLPDKGVRLRLANGVDPLSWTGQRNEIVAQDFTSSN